MTPAQIALAEFTNRQAHARRLVAQRTWTRDQAEARLRPWLAIALWTGAEPGIAKPLIDDWRAMLSHTHANTIYGKGGRPARAHPSAREVRCAAANDLCLPPQWRANLASARDAAATAARKHPDDAFRRKRADNLMILSAHLKVGIHPKPEAKPQRKAA